MRKILIELIAALLVLLFVFASVSKFLDFKTFRGEVNNQPLPNELTPFLVWGIPLIEIFLSIALMFNRTRLAALYGSAVFMLLFTVYSALVLFNFFEYVPCTCGGVIKNLTWTQNFFFDLFFVALAMAGILLIKKQPKTAVS
jgi:putative oxidoreductase